MAIPESAGKEFNIQSVTWGKLVWANIERPTESETEYLAQNYPFHHLELDDCISRIQRPKIDENEDEGYLFMVFHFPVFSKQAGITLPSQVSVFLGDNYLITLHQGELKPLVKLFRDCQLNEKAREEHMSRSSGYLLYQILDRLVNYCFPILYKIGANVDAIEDDVFTKPVAKTVQEILLIKRDLISFRRIIRPQIAMLHSLERREWAFIKDEMDVYFGDIGDHLNKIWDMLEDYREHVDNLTDASNWLTSHRIQEVMRILAVIAACVTPLIIVASIYGMNLVSLPLGNSTYGFPVVLAIMLCLVVIMLFIFRRKGWI